MRWLVADRGVVTRCQARRGAGRRFRLPATQILSVQSIAGVPLRPARLPAAVAAQTGTGQVPAKRTKRPRYRAGTGVARCKTLGNNTRRIVRTSFICNELRCIQPTWKTMV